MLDEILRLRPVLAADTDATVVDEHPVCLQVENEIEIYYLRFNL